MLTPTVGKTVVNSESRLRSAGLECFETLGAFDFRISADGFPLSVV